MAKKKQYYPRKTRMCLKCGHLYTSQSRTLAAAMRNHEAACVNNQLANRNSDHSSGLTNSKKQRTEYQVEDEYLGYLNDDASEDNQSENENFQLDNFEIEIPSNNTEQPPASDLLHSQMVNLIAGNNRVDTVYFKLQQEMMQEFHSDTLLKLNKINGIPPKISTCIKGFNYICSKGLSTRESEDLFDFVNDITKDINGKAVLPSSWRTLETSCMKGVIEQTKPKLKLMNLPKNIISNMNLKPIQSVVRDINMVIAETLLKVKNPNNFKEHYCGQPLSTGIMRLIGDFTTGDMFYKMCNALKREKGNEAVPLCIGITMDAATANRGNTRSECPVCMYILNLVGDDFGIEFLGYTPMALPFSHEEIKGMMNDNGVKIKDTYQKTIRLLKHKMLHEYLFHLLKPIKEYEEHGMILQVGTVNPKLVKCYPQICMFSGDTEQLHKLCSVTYRSSKRKCRLCMSSDNVRLTFPTYENFIYRDPFETQQVAEDMEGIVRNVICRASKFEIFREDLNRNNAKKIYEEAKENGITGGHNSLISIVHNQLYSSIIDLHKISLPDYLHTFLKGVVENALAWTLQILQTIGNINHKYNLNLALIDEMFKVFTDKQSLSVFREHFFSQGISKYLKETITNDGKQNATGQMSGGLEAWKLLPALFRLMICFGLRHADMVPSKIANIDDIPMTIMNCLVSVIDFAFYMRSKSLTVEKLNVSKRIGKYVGKCIIRLFRMKNALLNHNDNKFKIKTYQAIKLHLMEHFVAQKVYYGCDNRTYDTEISEKYHKVVVKASFERSSKQYSSSTMEMAKHVGRCARAQHLMSIIETNEIKTDNKRKEIPAPMDTIIVKVFGSQRFIPHNTTFKFVPKPKKGKAELSQQGITAGDYFLHPLITLPNLRLLLLGYMETNIHNEDLVEICDKLRCFFDGDTAVKFRLMGGVQVAGNQELGMEKFYLRCQPNYEHNSRGTNISISSEFSFIEIQEATSRKLCQILCISQLYWMVWNEIDQEWREDYFTFITYSTLKQISAPSSSILPYPMYAYARAEGARTFWDVRITHIESLCKPVFVIPANYDHWTTSYDLDTCESAKFYAITFDRVNPMYTSVYYDYFQEEDKEDDDNSANMSIDDTYNYLTESDSDNDDTDNEDYAYNGL